MDLVLIRFYSWPKLSWSEFITVRKLNTDLYSNVSIQISEVKWRRNCCSHEKCFSVDSYKKETSQLHKEPIYIISENPGKENIQDQTRSDS